LRLEITASARSKPVRILKVDHAPDRAPRLSRTAFPQARPTALAATVEFAERRAIQRLGWLEVPLLILIGVALLWANPKTHWRSDIVPDGSEVYYGTRNLVERGTYEIEVDGAFHPPRYSYGYSVFFLAPVYWLTGRPRMMFVVPMVCGIANLVLVYALTKRLHGRGAAVIAALLLLGLPSYFLTSWDILSHGPSLMLFLLVALLTPPACAGAWPGVLAALGIGVLSGVAVTLRPTNVLFFLPVGTVLILRHSPFGRELWLRGAAILAGALPLILPLLDSNLRTFGTLTRTGYSYWCAAIYDVPGKAFRYDFATVAKGIRFYAHPLGFDTNPWEICGLPSLLIIAIAGQVLVGLIRALRGAPRHRDQAIFALTTTAAFLALYLPYTFRFYWFMYPVYACLLPFLAGGLKGFWLGSDSGLRGDRLRVAGLGLLLVVCLVKRWYIPPESYDLKDHTGRQVQELKRLLPRDAVFFTSRDPLGVHEELVRGTDRVCVPLNRASEYTWTRILTRPPSARTEEAIAAESKPVFAQVFEEDPSSFLNQHRGRRIFIEKRSPAELTAGLPPGFDLVPITKAVTVSLFEVKSHPPIRE
jgi:hypothetical protein